MIIRLTNEPIIASDVPVARFHLPPSCAPDANFKGQRGRLTCDDLFRWGVSRPAATSTACKAKRKKRENQKETAFQSPKSLYGFFLIKKNKIKAEIPRIQTPVPAMKIHGALDGGMIAANKTHDGIMRVKSMH